MTPAAREAANRYIDAFIDDGQCDFMSAFADPFPADVFLNAVNLPAEDTPLFVGLGARRCSAASAARTPTPGPTPRPRCATTSRGCTTARRTQPGDLDVDILTYLLQAEVDGKPIPEDDLLNMAVVLVLAGLDTTKSQLGYNFHYLATHPEERARLVADPSLMPTAIEELLRFNAFVPPARKLKQDVEFEGCPMKAGQMVLMPLWSATRDPRAFEDGDTVKLDRIPEPPHRVRRRAAPVRRRPSGPAGAAGRHGGVAQADPRVRAGPGRADRRARLAVRARTTCHWCGGVGQGSERQR